MGLIVYSTGVLLSAVVIEKRSLTVASSLLLKECSVGQRIGAVGTVVLFVNFTFQPWPIRFHAGPVLGFRVFMLVAACNTVFSYVMSLSTAEA